MHTREQDKFFPLIVYPQHILPIWEPSQPTPIQWHSTSFHPHYYSKTTQIVPYTLWALISTELYVQMWTGSELSTLLKFTSQDTRITLQPMPDASEGTTANPQSAGAFGQIAQDGARTGLSPQGVRRAWGGDQTDCTSSRLPPTPPIDRQITRHTNHYQEILRDGHFEQQSSAMLFLLVRCKQAIKQNKVID